MALTKSFPIGCAVNPDNLSGTGGATLGMPSAPRAGVRATSEPNPCRSRANAGGSPVTAARHKADAPVREADAPVGSQPSPDRVILELVIPLSGVPAICLLWTSRRTNHLTAIAVRPASAPRLTPIGPLPADVPSPCHSEARWDFLKTPPGSALTR